MRFLLSLLVAMLCLMPDIGMAEQEVPTWDNSSLVPWKVKEIATLRYKAPQPEARYEWEVGSAIAEDISALNLISLPPVYITKDGAAAYPVLDILGIDYEIFKRYYSPHRLSSDMRLWTYAGYDARTLKPGGEFELKTVPPLRGRGKEFYGKYERTDNSLAFKLAIVSKRIAAQVFPEQYADIDSTEKRSEAPLFWQQVLNSHTPIVITEGHKKALSIISAGMPAIGLQGACSGLRLTRENESVVMTLHPELEALLAKNQRLFYINFDSDLDEQTREIVFSVTSALAEKILTYGHEIRIVVLPGTETKGADDFIAAHGVEKYRALFTNALTLAQFRKRYSPVSFDSLLQAFLTSKKHRFCFAQPSVQCDIWRKLSKKDRLAEKYEKTCRWTPSLTKE